MADDSIGTRGLCDIVSAAGQDNRGMLKYLRFTQHLIVTCFRYFQPATMLDKKIEHLPQEYSR
jgi:hypothetical protein